MTMRDQAIEVMTRAAIRSLYPQITDDEMNKPAQKWIGTAMHDASSSVLDDQKPELEAALDALLAFMAANGLCGVPAEMDVGMIAAFWRTKNGHHFHGDPPPTDTSDAAAYRAMIAAAPNPLAKDAP